VTVGAGEVEPQERGKLGMGRTWSRFAKWANGGGKDAQFFLGAKRSENTAFRE
jgi:hypothetical protein